jgi:hypothetical protein
LPDINYELRKLRITGITNCGIRLHGGREGNRQKKEVEKSNEEIEEI